MKIEKVKVSRLIPMNNNAKVHTPAQVAHIAASISQFGFNVPVVLGRGDVIICGHGRVEAAIKLGLKTIPAVRAAHLDDAQARLFALADNSITLETKMIERIKADEIADLKVEIEDLDLDSLGLKVDLLKMTRYGNGDEARKGSLSDRFIAPPFSILRAMDGKWQARKNYWLDAMGEGLMGRGYDLMEGGVAQMSTSLFDPTLAEILYTWFCPEEGSILDCYAGGVTRGYVAGALGFSYTGIDISQKQIKEDKGLAGGLKGVQYICGDGEECGRLCYETFDMLIACPPYYDLEKYSEDDRDMSNMKYDEFDEKLKRVVKASVALLNNNRFAAYIVGQARDKKGEIHPMAPGVISAFNAAGMFLYNRMILATNIVSAPIRSRGFLNRKVVGVHQDVLVFYKGDQRNIKNMKFRAPMEIEGEPQP